jgi:hypothetical protein
VADHFIININVIFNNDIIILYNMKDKVYSSYYKSCIVYCSFCKKKHKEEWKDCKKRINRISKRLCYTCRKKGHISKECQTNLNNEKDNEKVRNQ